MKKEKIKQEEIKQEEIAVCSSGEGIIEGVDPDTEPDTDGEGKNEGDDDNSGRPNRGTGSAGPKRPIGTGGKGQYSLRNPNEQEA